MGQRIFYNRKRSETVTVPTDGAVAVLALFRGLHLVNPEQALRCLGGNYFRLFAAFSPAEIDEALAEETGRELVMVATKDKGPGATTPTSNGDEP